MPPSATQTLSPELEAVAVAAADRLRAGLGADSQAAESASRAIIVAASEAMGSGVGLGEIAAAEQVGQQRVREELGKECLRAVERLVRRRREIDNDYEQAVRRAGALGLAHRDIASAAGAAPATIRALLTRSVPANVSVDGAAPEPE